MTKRNAIESLIQQGIADVEKSEAGQPDLPVRPIDRPIGKYCDHTVLHAYTPQAIVKRFCDEAKQYHAATLCVNPCHIRFISGQLQGSDVNVGAAVGFPLGAVTMATKAFETGEAVNNGADEVDYVMNIGAARDHNYTYLYEEACGVVKAAVGKPVKAILETCYLNREEKIALCVIAKAAGAAYVKTSTGFGTGGAMVKDIVLMRRAVNDDIKIKAATNILTYQDARKMIAAGADRLGVSRLVQIVMRDDSLRSAAHDNQPPKC